MYYFDKRLQYPVTVEKPDPIFARQLQQAIGGVDCGPADPKQF
jgi:Mn-containing catalase